MHVRASRRMRRHSSWPSEHRVLYFIRYELGLDVRRSSLSYVPLITESIASSWGIVGNVVISPPSAAASWAGGTLVPKGKTAAAGPESSHRREVVRSCQTFCS
jgi:hypothetical protein